MTEPIPFGEVTGTWDVPVYLIGGGPSLHGFDFAKLKGIRVGINKSAWFYDLDVFCTMDQYLVRKHRKDIEGFAAQGKPCYAALPPNEQQDPIPGVTYLIRRRNSGLSRRPTDLFGVHSGMASLNLAYLKKAKEVGLLGYDMGYSKDGRTHHHGGYPWHARENAKFYTRWAKDFATCVPQLNEAGMHVVNFVGNPPSRIDCFPRSSLEDL